MPSDLTDTKQVIERIKQLFRRDLKLPADAVLSDDMPLMGSDLDLDSLDLLMLLTSVEKEFGVKVAAESTPRETFKSLSSLATFIAARAKPGQTVQAPAGNALPANPLDRLPHQPPFRFLTRVLALREGHAGDATWNLSGNEPFFAGHFPGDPIVPGVLITEALAQLAGLVLPASTIGTGKATAGRLAHFDLRFDSSARPPVEVLLHAALTSSIAPLFQFEVRATVGTQVIARGSLTLHVTRV